MIVNIYDMVFLVSNLILSENLKLCMVTSTAENRASSQNKLLKMNS